MSGSFCGTLLSSASGRWEDPGVPLFWVAFVFENRLSDRRRHPYCLCSLRGIAVLFCAGGGGEKLRGGRRGGVVGGGVAVII